MPPVPFSRAYVLLLVAVPGIWLLARALVHRLTRDLGLRTVLPIGLGIALWVVSIQLASHAAGSLHVGLPLGVIGAAAAGVAAEVARRRRPDPEPPTGARPSAWMWVTAVAGAAIFVPAAFRFYFHDELFVGGHMAVAAQIQSAPFPPRNLQFPEFPLRYHYGFDLFAASLTPLLRLRVDQAIDVATLSLWMASWCLLWALGERLVGRPRAFLTPAMTLFAGGLPLFCLGLPFAAVSGLISECSVGHWSVNGPMASYFFQHPWALGIPLATAAILVFTERDPGSPRLRLGLLAFLLATLSLSEVALFVCLVPSLVVAELRYEDRLELRRLPGALVAALAAVAGSMILGGFFVRAPGLTPPGFVLHGGFADTFPATVRWNLMTFGAMWATGILGFVVLRRGRLLFGLLAGGALVVVNSLRYAGGSADIMKFATVVSLGLGMLGSAGIATLWPPSSPTPRPSLLRAVVCRVLAVALFVPAIAVSAFYPLVFALNLPTIPGSYRGQPDLLSPDDVQAAIFVRERAQAGDMVYRGPGIGYSLWAGLPLPWLHWTTKKVWGFPPEKIAAREVLLRDKPAAIAAWKAQGFRFVVLDQGARDDKKLVDAASAWVAKGEARVVATFGKIEVVEVLP